MACFVVPLVQAIATSVYRKKNEKSIASPDSSPFKHQLPALEKMLWGGSIMLIVDHIINGEFFAWNPLELLTVGLPMSLAVTAIWAVYCYAKERKIARI